MYFHEWKCSVNRLEAMRAIEALAASPAAKWIGNRLVGGVLLQKCMRCGAEQTLELPRATITAFQGGARGDDLAREVPEGFDEKVLAWKRAFQIAHEGCEEPPEQAA